MSACTRKWNVLVAVALTGIVAATIAGTAGGAAAARHPFPPKTTTTTTTTTTIMKPSGPSSWHLVDYSQKACIGIHSTDTYYGIWINGTWTRTVNVGADHLPAGAGYDTSYAPIAPGSSTGIYSLAYVRVILNTRPPAGTYTASLWASDGSTRESVPITIVVQDSCRSY
jgi:hypothetical protein